MRPLSKNNRVFSNKKAGWKKLHEQQNWRELALSVMSVGYLGDLSYFMLAESAKGLGLAEMLVRQMQHLTGSAKKDATQSGSTRGTSGSSAAGSTSKSGTAAGAAPAASAPTGTITSTGKAALRLFRQSSAPAHAT